MRLDELGQAFIFRLFNMRLQYKDAHKTHCASSLDALSSVLRRRTTGDSSSRRVTRLCVRLYTDDQGWVDYKIFVVRYNYSYFKNM